MLHRYLNWVGYNTKSFNAGDYRRKVNYLQGPNPQYGYSGEGASFFDPNNADGAQLRNKFAVFALDGKDPNHVIDVDLMAFLMEDGDVGIFDATNTTRDRRQNANPVCDASQQILERCWHAEFDVLFIESICDDPVLLKKNYDMKLSNSGNC